VKHQSHLLSDTKLRENIPQDFVSGYFAGDFTQVVKRLFDVNGYQVGWDIFLKSFINLDQDI